MPVTLLSHQALVLPLKMRWPRRFSGLALCLGSMAPDLEFIWRMTDDWLFSHTVTAQLWFTIPLTMALVWLVSALLVPALLPFLRDHPEWRLHDLAALEPPRGWRGWSSAALSAWIGGMSHVILDGITHGNHSGWLVPWMPFLRTVVPHLGASAPLHDALQFWLTILFAIASAFMWRAIARDRLLWRWRQRAARDLPRKPRAAGRQLIVLAVLAGVQGAVVGRAIQPDGSTRALAAAMGFGAIDFACLALLIAAIVARRRGGTTRLPIAEHAEISRRTRTKSQEVFFSASSASPPRPPRQGVNSGSRHGKAAPQAPTAHTPARHCCS